MYTDPYGTYLMLPSYTHSSLGPDCPGGFYSLVAVPLAVSCYFCCPATATSNHAMRQEYAGPNFHLSSQRGLLLLLPLPLLT